MSTSIPTSTFYSTTDFIPPALRPGRGREKALQAACQDPCRRLRTFPTQINAFQYCDQHPMEQLHVWAMEIDSSGRRLFTVASYSSFWRFYSKLLRRKIPLHYYEVIRERNGSRLYFDLEFLKQFNPEKNGEQMVQALIQMVRELSGQDEQVVQLDSTTEKKFSRHLIFCKIAFYDNVQAGEFVKMVVQKIREKDTKLMDVFKSEDEVVPFVDLAVYSRNRCFRLVGSSKFGNTTTLQPVHLKEGQGISPKLFMHSLVCAIDGNVKLRGHMSPLEGYMPTDINEKNTMTTKHENVQRTCAYPKLDDYIMQLISPSRGGIYGVTMLGNSGDVIYAIKGGYKYCANIGRHHKSNNVLFYVQVREGRIHQRCFDPDCRGFRSNAWNIPNWVFGASEDEEMDEEQLVIMLTEVEHALKLDGGVADEVMNQLMDSYLNCNKTQTA